MRHKSFMVLTGHLDDYSLPGLIRMLHGQRKSGRLQVEYAESPAAFYFEDGRLVDARLGDLRGIEALYLALSLPGASFNFNPLVKPPERTVEERQQKLIQELLEAPAAGGALDAHASLGAGQTLAPVTRAVPIPAQLQVADTQPPSLPAAVEERLMSQVGAALASHSRRFSRERAAYAGVIAALLLLTFIVRMREGTAPAGPGVARTQEVAPPRPEPAAEAAPPADAPKQDAPAAELTPAGTREAAAEARAGEPAPRPADPNAAKDKKRPNKQSKTPEAETASAAGAEPKAARGESIAAGQRGRVVRVVMQVERGRVLQAVIQNSRPGMESFESLALRMARQRQYPRDFSGRDVLELKVRP